MAKILVVEQDLVVRRMLVFFFTEHAVIRHSVHEASGIPQVQKMITEANPAYGLVITGNRFADGSGVDLTRWLKKHHPHIGVVLVSGGPDEPAGHEADIFVRKPFNIHTLDLAVENLLTLVV